MASGLQDPRLVIQLHYSGEDFTLGELKCFVLARASCSGSDSTRQLVTSNDTAVMSDHQLPESELQVVVRPGTS